MRRALRRAGWALAAAGMGIAGPAVAQAPVMQIIGPGGHVVEQTGQVIVMTEGHARLEEGQVELGLLADPMLFSYGLGAHVQGATLEVRGFVPTEEARDQALKVAREQTSLHVIDKLKIQPNLATRCSIDKPENIQRAAKELLEDAIPVYGRGMDVKCDARGRVTVLGSVASFEDRVLVSRKLRQVSGCSCVANRLEVASAETESRPPVPTGAVVIPDAPPVTAKPAVRKWEPSAPPVPVHTVATPIHKDIDPPSLGMPKVHSEPVVLPPTPPVSPRPATAAVPKEITPPTLVMPRVYQEPVGLPPAPVPMVKPQLDPPQAPLPTAKPQLDPPPAPKRWVPPVIDVTPSQVKTETPRPVPVPNIDKDRPYGGGSPGATGIDLPPVDHPKPTPAVKLPDVVIEPSAHAPKPPPLPTVPPLSAVPPAPAVPLPPKASVPPLPKLPTAEKHDRGGSEESYVAEGTITLDDEPPPVKPVGPSQKAPTTPKKPADGTLILTPPPMPPSRPASTPVALSVPPAKPPAPATPPGPTVPPAVRLKERIQGICGPAFEINVTNRGKNYLQLDVTGGSGADGQRLMERITPVLKSQEFSSFEINVDIVISGK
jgi:BON domain